MSLVLLKGSFSSNVSCVLFFSHYPPWIVIYSGVVQFDLQDHNHDHCSFWKSRLVIRSLGFDQWCAPCVSKKENQMTFAALKKWVALTRNSAYCCFLSLPENLHTFISCSTKMALTLRHNKSWRITGWNLTTFAALVVLVSE